MDRTLLFSKILEKLYPYRVTLAKMTKLPLLGKIIDTIFFSKGDDLIYLPKNELVQVNEYVEAPENIALPSKVVEHFIKKASYIWRMNYCICRKSNHCENYPIDLGCLFLGEAAKKIPSKYGEEITEEEALEHINRAQELGLVQMIGRTKFDSVWLDVETRGKLLVICFCCTCCCLVLSTLKNLDSKVKVKSVVNRMPGVRLEVTDSCVGCGKCAEVCNFDAIKIEEDKAVIGDICRGCGLCADKCPEDAIRINIEESEFLEKSIERIEKAVDVE